VKRLADKPFVLLGINSDEDRKALPATLKEERISWRSWWDDGSIEGPIQTKWQIAQRPAIYVLDAKGVIRYKNVTGDDLDKAIDSLLAETAAKPRKP